MLTSVGRAAARRVVSINRTLTTTGATATPRLAARPAIAVRSLTTSRWSFNAAKATATKPAKSASKSRSSSSTKDGSARGRPRKGSPPKAKKAKKPKAVKKKPVKKAKKPAKPKRPAKKVLTPEQALRRKVRDLRKTALLKEEPSTRKPTSFNVYVQKNMQGVKGQTLRPVAQSYKDISEAEREELARQGEAQHEQNLKDQKVWQASIPVEDIYLANIARNHLRRLNKRTPPNIQDDRMPRRPISPLNALIKRDVNSEVRLGEVAARYRDMSDAEREALAPNFQQQLREYKNALDVIRQMAKLKIKQGKAAPELEEDISKE